MWSEVRFDDERHFASAQERVRHACIRYLELAAFGAAPLQTGLSVWAVRRSASEFALVFNPLAAEVFDVLRDEMRFEPVPPQEAPEDARTLLADLMLAIAARIPA